MTFRWPECLVHSKHSDAFRIYQFEKLMQSGLHVVIEKHKLKF
jgi:hypothetical protein